jgi:eukaryotic-like serine/threonine-protein kinase
MKVKQHISFAQLVGTTIKHYRLEQLVRQEPHVALFLARCSKAEDRGTCSRCGLSLSACACPDSTEQIYQLRLFTLSAEITAQERLILLGQVQEKVSRIAALHHPVIQPILEYGHERGMMYLITPFIPAHYALAHILSTQGPLDIVQTGHNLERLASGLEYAHKHAIAHGNLTASAVFLGPSFEDGRREADGGHPRSYSPRSLPSNPPTLQLADIGIAHLQTLFMRDHGVGAGLVPAFYQAEQALGRPTRSMTDIAALGALLYQMLTAHDVFANGLQASGKQADIPPLHTWRSDLPAQLDAVISTALARNPTAGYQSLNALVDAYYQAAMPGVAPTHISSQVVEPRSVSHKTLVSVPSSESRKDIDSRRLSTGKGNTPNPNESSGNALGEKRSRGINRSGVLTQQPLTRRKVTAAAATGAAIVAVAGGWLFLQPQQKSQVVQESKTVTNPAPTGEQTVVPNATSPQQPTNNGMVIAHATDLPVNHASTFTIPNTTKPGLLIHLSGDSFVAFESTCTHQGCTVSYSTASKQIECPCHGAVFDPTRDAAVVVGPAPRPLPPINIHVSVDGTITVA